MTDEEFQEKYEAVERKESPLDGSCTAMIVSGRFGRHLMEKFGLIRYAGVHGKTRIVIEYDNDTGEGWRRIVAEDSNTVPTPKGLRDMLYRQQENPVPDTPQSETQRFVDWLHQHFMDDAEHIKQKFGSPRAATGDSVSKAQEQ